MTAPEETWDAAESVPLAPCDLGAERMLLATLMLAPALLDELPPLTSEHFYGPANAAVFEAIAAQHAAGEPADPVALAERMTKLGTLKRAGGHRFLVGLFTDSRSTAEQWHAKQIIEKALLRRIVTVGTRMAQDGQQPAAESSQVLFTALGELTALSEAAAPSGPVEWAKIVNTTLDAIDEASTAPPAERGIPFGLADLDRMTNGLQPGQLVFIAARPGVGKTVCSTGIARGAAFDHGIPTLLASLEMSRVEMAKRFISAQYKLMLHKLTSAALTDGEWVELVRRTAEHANAPLWIDDTAGQSLQTITAAARRLHRQHKLRLLVVDYLQLIDIPSIRRAENRQQEVANLSKGLKRLARELHIPVVVCAQLNRDVEKRQDKRPLLSDLRESGSLEQDADLVVLLHRPDYYNAEDRPGEVDFDLAKNRHGPTGVVTAAAQLHFSRFVDMADGSDFGQLEVAS